MATLVLGSSVSIEKGDKDALTRCILPNISVPAASRSINIYIEPIEKFKDWFKSQWKYSPILPSSNLHEFILRQIADKKIDKKRVLEILQEADLGIEDIQIKEEEENLSGEERKMFLADINANDSLPPARKKEMLQYFSDISTRRITKKSAPPSSPTRRWAKRKHPSSVGDGVPRDDAFSRSGGADVSAGKGRPLFGRR